MGETNTITSSKRKSSSLIKKKKRSHDLHKADKKKTKRSKSKIRKRKSKKLRRRDNSSSYSDSDDDDESSKSLSSSDSIFDDHKRKRSRSRTQYDGKKKSKKKTRKRSPSSESEWDQRRRVKKGKGLKRNIDSGMKKKSRRKKHKRDAKISPSRSSSSSSLSCSISGASSCEDLGRNGSKRRRYRSPSCSSIRRWSEGDYQTENNLISENISRRLRSVIIVVKEPGVNEVEMDKEEIIPERDDYPSCRSNDSDDAKMKIDEEMKGVRDAVMGIDMNDRYEPSYPSEDEYAGARQVSKNKNEDFNDDEIILRQRALENLIKFRREELKTKATSLDLKGKKDDAVKQSPSLIAGLLPRNEDGAKVPITVNASQENSEPTMLKVDGRSSQHRRRSQAPELVKGKEDGSKLPITNQGVNQFGIPRNFRNSILSMREDRKLREGKHTSEDIYKNSKPNMSVLGLQPQDAYSSLKQVPTSQQRPQSNVDNIAVEIIKPSLDNREDSEKQVDNNNVKQVLTSQQGPKNYVNSNAAEISKPSLIIRDDSGKQVSNNVSVSSVSDPSCVKPETGEQSSKDVLGETKDASQYQQKTMSVMRGGEMVQVNYKVYIPKKTPALARRQLQR